MSELSYNQKYYILNESEEKEEIKLMSFNYYDDIYCTLKFPEDVIIFTPRCDPMFYSEFELMLFRYKINYLKVIADGKRHYIFLKSKYYQRDIENGYTALSIVATIKRSNEFSYKCKINGAIDGTIINSDEENYQVSEFPFIFSIDKKLLHPYFETPFSENYYKSAVDQYKYLMSERLLTPYQVEQYFSCIKLINHEYPPFEVIQREAGTIEKPVPLATVENVKDMNQVGEEFLKNHYLCIYNKRLYMFIDNPKNEFYGIWSDDERNIESALIDEYNLNSSKREEVYKYLVVKAPIHKLNDCPNYIAFRNGVYDAHTLKFEPFRQEHHITKKLPHNYNENAQSDILDTFINKISDGDKLKVMLIHEMFGRCLYSQNIENVAFFIIGATANGKSTLLEFFKECVGAYNCSFIKLHSLDKQFTLCNLKDKLINFSDDVSLDYIKEPDVFKNICTGDTITVNQKYKDDYQINFYGAFIITGNGFPRMNDNTKAVLRRMLPIRFTHNFLEDPDRDDFIRYKLSQREVIEAMYLKGLEGLTRLLINKTFTRPTDTEFLLELINEQNDPTEEFFQGYTREDCHNLTVGYLYEQYKYYCSENGLSPKGKKTFSADLKIKYDLRTKMTSLNGIKGHRYVYPEEVE